MHGTYLPQSRAPRRRSIVIDQEIREGTAETRTGRAVPPEDRDPDLRRLRDGQVLLVELRSAPD